MIFLGTGSYLSQQEVNDRVCILLHAAGLPVLGGHVGVLFKAVLGGV